MAGSVNKVILVGNLGRDPEVRSTQDGTKIVHLAVATSERWRDRNSGENRERTEWHRVVIFNERLGEVAEKYLSKGRSVYLEGACRPANGRTSRARSATRPRSCCNASGASWSCSAAATRAASPAPAPRPTTSRTGGGRQARRRVAAAAAGRGGAPRRESSEGFDDLDDEIPF